MKAGRYSTDEWNKLLDNVKSDLVDISEPLPFKTCYFGCNSFYGVCFDKKTRKFFKVEGSINGVTVKDVSDMEIRKIYER